jgi:hypothetical protein
MMPASPRASSRNGEQSAKSTALSGIRQLERQFGQLPESGFNKALRLLTVLERGNTIDARTPFFGSRRGEKFVYRDREEIASILDSKIEGVSSGDTDMLEVLRQLEMDQRKDIGPWSMFLPWSEDGPKKAVAVYANKSYTEALDGKALSNALEWVQTMVKTQSVQLTSIDQAIEGTKSSDDELSPTGLDTTTNSGYPYFSSGWRPTEIGPRSNNPELAEVFRYHKEQAQKWLNESNAAKGSIPDWVAISFQRLVQKGPEPFGPKTKRLVIAFPKEEAILAKTFTPALMDQIRTFKADGGVRVMCAWFELPVIDVNMQHMLNIAHENDRTVLSGDVSNFDATVPPDLLLRVGNVVASWIRGGERLVNMLFEAMISATSLLTPGKLYKATTSSLKSGSGLTNLTGSLSNLTMLRYGHERGLYKIENICVLGDDFVMDGPGVEPDAVSECFSHFGMLAHPDKQFFTSRSLHYLQRLHWLGRPGGIASVYRTLGHVLGLERLPSGKNYGPYAYIVRALSQIQNCVFNPYFGALIDTVKEGDKYSLGADFADPMQLLAKAGPVGAEMLEVSANQPWKVTGSETSFSNWLVNGYLRGEKLPQGGGDLFMRVYGKVPDL